MFDTMNVCVLVYEGFDTFAYSVVREIFGPPHNEGRPSWTFKQVGEPISSIPGNWGLQTVVAHSPEVLESADIVIIPGWDLNQTRISDNLQHALKCANARGARILAISSGVFLVALSGIVGSRSVVVSPQLLSQFENQFPEVIVNNASVYMEADNLYTAVSGAAAIDMAVYVIKQSFGVNAANRVARRLVIPSHRDGQFAQFTAKSLPNFWPGHIGLALEEIRGDLGKDWDIPSLAKLTNTSPRTLQRRFKAATGFSPQVWLIKERIRFAKELLETTNLSIQQVAEVTGLKSPETFRHHFKKLVGTNPTKYRSNLHNKAP